MMRSLLKSFFAGLILAAWSFFGSVVADDTPATSPNAILKAGFDSDVPFFKGWTARAPREEIRPVFAFEPNGGPKKAGSFVIRHDQREGLDGWMQKSFDVAGGEFVRFQAVRKLTDVALPRRSALVRVLWQNDAGKMVSADVPEQQVKELGHVPTAEPEHPVDGSTDANGWTTVSGVYRVPMKATRAVVELHLQWAPNGRVEWSDVEFAKTTPPPSRKVRLATIHYKPMGKSSRENCEEFAPLIAEAAKQRADLVVLGETVPTASANVKPQKVEETAEPIPGPSTDYFGELAKKHNLHIVLSLYERDRHLVYNSAVLLGPDGKLIGKYRKVCLPHGEVEKGIAPGHDYPVFDTKFGKVGMMVCYDGFFPEVARELSNRGAEVIAWPVWGCNPQLAKARACENHVYIVSSTFMAPKDGWMLSAVFDQTGKPIAHAETWGTVAVAEVELSQPYIGPWNLGDFRSMIERHRPVIAEQAQPPFDIRLDTISSGFDKKSCWVHPRAGAIPGATPTVVLTMQKAMLVGSDIFYALNEMRTDDLGKTWSQPVEHTDTLGRRDEPKDVVVAASDFWPKWHAKSGKLLGIGHNVRYQNNKVMPAATRRRETVYSVYDPAQRTWTAWDTLPMPDADRFFNSGAGSVQRLDLPDGDILLPIYFTPAGEKFYRATVLRCGFDGRKLAVKEVGNELRVDIARGLAEPSLTRFRGRFYLTLRNDQAAYVSTSDDGLHFSEPRPWQWDDGTDLGSYDTQAHWVTHDDALYLVYTRRGANNDHIPRNRAPLFIGQVDIESLRVLRGTERELMPQRGAKLGNFGVTEVNEHETWITDAEWMQTKPPNYADFTECMKYGSDNAVFAARIHWKKLNTTWNQR